MRSKQRTLDLGEDGLANVLHNTRAGFHRAAAGMARGGNNVIVDHVLIEPWRLTDCLAVFQGLDVLFVGVRCWPTELRRRERVRGDRPLGLAESQLASVHAMACMTSRSPTMRAPQPNTPSGSSEASQSIGHKQPLNSSVVSHRRLNDRPSRVVGPGESKDRMIIRTCKPRVKSVLPMIARWMSD
jgi:hypothetical protein